MLLEDMESRGDLKYWRADSSSTPDVERWSSATQLPELGKAEGAQASTCRAYLITEAKSDVRSRPVIQADGKPRFDVDQLLNPDSIVFTPAGEWKEEMILAGSFGTAYDSAASQALMKRVSSAIRKNFSKVRGYWVGPEALGQMKAGKRLTIAEQSPPSYDLREGS
jgi:hypothetical protein